MTSHVRSALWTLTLPKVEIFGSVESTLRKPKIVSMVQVHRYYKEDNLFLGFLKHTLYPILIHNVFHSANEDHM